MAEQPTPLTAAKGHIRLALLRHVPERGNLDANFQVFKEATAQASEAGADLLITPECFLDGYYSQHETATAEGLLKVAQSVNESPYLKAVAALAREYRLWICFGFTELRDGEPHNAAGLWNEDGQRVGTYHKNQLQKFDLKFTPGTDLPVFPTRWGPVGIMICADRRWPEIPRAYAVQGARLILNPTYGFFNDLNTAMMRTRGYENECYIAFTHPRESLVTGTAGEIVVKATAPEEQDNPPWQVTLADIDLNYVDDHGHMEIRRPEIYQALTETKP